MQDFILYTDNSIFSDTANESSVESVEISVIVRDSS